MRSFTNLILVATCLTLLSGGATLAQQPPGPPPEGARGAMVKQPPSAADKARMAVVQGWGDLIDQGKVEEAFDRYVSKDFIEHSYMVKRLLGRQDLGFTEIRDFFKTRMGGGAKDGRKIAEVLVANDEIVTIDGRIGQDLYRVVDGKILEHWDTIHQGAGSPANAKPH